MNDPTRAGIARPSSLERPVLALAAGLALATALGSGPACAQNAAQMEYDRQQREYRQALERQREEQLRMQQLQQENARRQQESQRPAALPQGYVSPPTYGGATYAGGSAAPHPAGDPLRLCKAHPLRPGERNPLLGRWQPKDTPKGDPFTQLLQSMAAPQCMAFAMGLELRQDELVSVVGSAPARYGHKGDEWYVCLPQSTVQVLTFRLQGNDQLIEVGSTCRLVHAR